MTTNIPQTLARHQTSWQHACIASSTPKTQRKSSSIPSETDYNKTRLKYEINEKMWWTAIPATHPSWLIRARIFFFSKIEKKKNLNKTKSETEKERERDKRDNQKSLISFLFLLFADPNEKIEKAQTQNP